MWRDVLSSGSITRPVSRSAPLHVLLNMSIPHLAQASDLRKEPRSWRENKSEAVTGTTVSREGARCVERADPPGLDSWVIRSLSGPTLPQTSSKFAVIRCSHTCSRRSGVFDSLSAR